MPPQGREKKQLKNQFFSPPGPKLTGTECVEGMAAGLYEELFAAVVSLINRYYEEGCSRQIQNMCA